jgi:acetyl-CoA hydrolase
MPASSPLSNSFDFSQVLKSGDHVAWPQGTGEPTGLTARLMSQAPELPRATLVLGMVSTATLATPNLSCFDFLCINGAGNTRVAVARSGVRVIPAHISALPSLIASRRIPVDVALIRVRPTNQPDVYSLGVMVDYVHELIAAARVVVAEIDEQMPLVGGDALVPAGTITHFVRTDREGPGIDDPVPGDTDVLIAQRIAAIIPDRATVQVGVGGLPVAMCAALKDHKDLGLHSGVIPDAVVPLLEAYRSLAGCSARSGCSGTPMPTRPSPCGAHNTRTRAGRTRASGRCIRSIQPSPLI